jgi:hypothetical protein
VGAKQSNEGSGLDSGKTRLINRSKVVHRTVQISEVFLPEIDGNGVLQQGRLDATPF